MATIIEVSEEDEKKVTERGLKNDRVETEEKLNLST